MYQSQPNQSTDGQDDAIYGNSHQPKLKGRSLITSPRRTEQRRESRVRRRKCWTCPKLYEMQTLTRRDVPTSHSLLVSTRGSRESGKTICERGREGEREGRPSTTMTTVNERRVTTEIIVEAAQAVSPGGLWLPGLLCAALQSSPTFSFSFIKWPLVYLQQPLKTMIAIVIIRV